MSYKLFTYYIHNELFRFFYTSHQIIHSKHLIIFLTKQSCVNFNLYFNLYLMVQFMPLDVSETK